jgi:phenylacetate-CoA ligase
MASDAVRQANFAFGSAAAIRQAQERRIGAAVAHARAHVPYYRETMRRMILGTEDFRTAEDLARLPLLEREQLQRDPEYFVSEHWPIGRCVLLESGGSTGAPVLVFRDPASFFAGAAHYERLRAVIRRLAGRWVRYREAVILPQSSTTGDTFRALRSRTKLPKSLQVQLRTFALRPPAELIGELNAYRPDVIGAYGSFLEALFVHVREHSPRFVAPRVVVYGADSMSPAARAWVQGTLGIEVLSNYGAIEAPHIGFECEAHRGYHLNVDLSPLRLVGADGRGRPDEPGEVVVSNLVNRGTVLLNYRLGDVATAIAEPCECGRNLPLLSYLERTKLAWLDLGDGLAVHAQLLRRVLYRAHGIWSFQIVQVSPREFHVRLVATRECDRTGTGERVARGLREHLPDGVAIRLEFVQELPRGPSGKIQPIVALSHDPQGSATRRPASSADWADQAGHGRARA